MKGVIFDLDGVISDTHRLQNEIERELLDECGVGSVDLSSYAGVPDEEMFLDIQRLHGVYHRDVDWFIEEKWSRFEEKWDQIRVIDGVEGLIKELHERGCKLAVASGTPEGLILEVMEQLKLGEYFNVLVSSEEVPQGKPAPDVFLKAAELLGVDPGDALVIEDGKAGIAAAKAAGMRSVFLGSEEIGATLTLPSFSPENIRVILDLVSG